MQWTKPDFQEITLGMEVTAYVNTDERQRSPETPPRSEPAAAVEVERREKST